MLYTTSGILRFFEVHDGPSDGSWTDGFKPMNQILDLSKDPFNLSVLWVFLYQVRKIRQKGNDLRRLPWLSVMFPDRLS